MSNAYGPIVFTTAGTIVAIQIGVETDTLVIENKSLNDALFSLSPSKPQATSISTMVNLVSLGQPITQAGWDAHVGANSVVVMRVPDQYLTQSPLGGYWQGSLWMMQLQLVDEQSVTPGAVYIPGNSLWITTYGPGEDSPVPGVYPMNYPALIQPRSVSVPIVPGFNIANTITASAVTTWTTVPPAISIFNYPFNSLAINDGYIVQGFMACILYGLDISMQPLGGVAAVAQYQRIRFRLAIQDSVGTIVSSVPAGQGDDGIGTFFITNLGLLSLQSSANDGMQGHLFPIGRNMGITAGAGQPYSIVAQVYIDNPSGGGGTNIKPLEVNAQFDIAPFYPPAIAGGFAQYSAHSFNGSLLSNLMPY
jgi:hypothetical protein